MSDEQRFFFAIFGAPPVRLSVEQTAWALNCQPHDVPVLVEARLLKPLGNPKPNAVKFFSTFALQQLGEDLQWQARATNSIYEHRRLKNGRRRGDEGELGLAA